MIYSIFVGMSRGQMPIDRSLHWLYDYYMDTNKGDADRDFSPAAAPHAGVDGIMDWAWCAGFLCALGTFTLHEGRPLLIVKSSRDRDSVARFASVIHANANRCMINGKPGLRVTVSGERLHKVMKAVWPNLTRTRKLDYVRIRARSRDWQEALAGALESESEEGHRAA